MHSQVILIVIPPDLSMNTVLIAATGICLTAWTYLVILTKTHKLSLHSNSKKRKPVRMNTLGGVT